ncbi:MAG: inositol monophosphatase family protein [Brevinema sp.]
MDYQEYLDTALSIIRQCVPIFQEGFVKTNRVTWKGEGDPVTEYDKKIEFFIRQQITQKYPDHIILGEEEGLQNSSDSKFQWIVDPIDGTNNYIRGINFVSLSLALAYQNEIIVSVVADPNSKEYFWAIKGKGAFLNDEKIQVSKTGNLKQSYIALGTYKEKYIKEFHQMIHTFQSVRNPGSAALAMAYVAAGRIEGAVYFSLSAWDVAGGWLLIKEAGGIISNIDGTPFTLENPSLLTGNAISYPVLQKIFTTQ